MTTTTANMSLTLPVLGSDPGTWDNSLNSTINVIDLHDHTSGKGVRVPSTGIGINADLTYAGYSITNLRAAVYTAQASFATALSTYVIGNDLYFRDGASNQIRLTASGAINIATTGGFTGDYIAAGAAAYYDDVNETYRFLEAAPAPNSWSRVACGSVDLYEHASGITNRVRLSSPAALGASYEVTWPAALPGSTLLTQVSAAGVMTWSNTIANAVTLGAPLTTGAVAAADQHFTVSGAGRFKHGTFTRMIHATAGFASDPNIFAASPGYVTCNPSGTLHVAIPMNDGERLISVDFTYYGNGVNNIDWDVVRYSASAAGTTLDSGSIGAPAAAWATLSGNLINYTLVAGNAVVVEINPLGGNMRFGHVVAYIDRP